MSQPPELQTRLSATVSRRRQDLGLTQAALARQAGCTRQYVAQLERGERTRPSAAVCLGLARALQLSGAARAELLALAGHVPDEAAPRDTAEVSAVAAELLALLPAPALLHDGTWHIQRLNGAAQDTLRALGIAAQPGRSLLSLVFEERYRPFFPQWEPWARYVLAQFKRDSLPLSRTPVHAALLAELRALPDFPRLWRHVSPAAADAPLMPVVYRPPGQPPLTFTLTRVQFVGTPELWGIVFLPVGPAVASGPAR